MLAVTLSELSQAFVIGIITGAAYSMVALGLVLVYKSSGVFNFAQGEFGTVGVYTAFAVVTFLEWPYAAAIVLGLLASLATGLATERFVIRPLADAPRVTLLVATAGVSLLAIGAEFWRSGDVQLRFLPPISQNVEFIKIAGVSISTQRILILLALAVVAGALAAFFRSPYGLAILAASQEPTAAELMGVNVNRISQLVWGLAALLGGLAGVLLAGVTGQFAPGYLTAQALIPGFIGAVIGGLTSLPGAVLGGLLIGVLQALGGLSTFDAIPGSSAVTVFVLLLGVLLVKPEGLLGGRSA